MNPACRRVFTAAFALMAGIAAATAAHAERWRLDEANSELRFAYRENEIMVGGEFERFDGSALFDPSHPARASLTLKVDATSMSLGHPLREHIARSADWFDVAKYPEALFSLKNMKPMGDGLFEATGELTIHGHTNPVTLPVRLDVDRNRIVASGEFEITRADYGVGVGLTSMLADVGETIDIIFRLQGEPF